jgi:hypothetical protein
MQSSEGFQRFTQHLEQHHVVTKLCRVNFENYVTNTLLPAINENNGQFKTWGVMLATSKIGIGEDDKVQTTCDRVFGFILFELFSIDVETYGAPSFPFLCFLFVFCLSCLCGAGTRSATDRTGKAV